MFFMLILGVYFKMETEKRFLMRCSKLIKKGAHSSVALLVEKRIKRFQKIIPK